MITHPDQVTDPELIAGYRELPLVADYALVDITGERNPTRAVPCRIYGNGSRLFAVAIYARFALADVRYLAGGYNAPDYFERAIAAGIPLGMPAPLPA